MDKKINVLYVFAKAIRNNFKKAIAELKKYKNF